MNTPGLLLRRMALDDAPAVAALCGELGYPGDTATLAARLARLLDRTDHALFIATRGDAVVGWGHGFVSPLVESDACVEIAGLVVSAAVRGQGVGTRLVETLLGWAHAQGVTGVRVRSNVRRDQAHAFYRARGFVEIKTQRVFARAAAVSGEEAADAPA